MDLTNEGPPLQGRFEYAWGLVFQEVTIALRTVSLPKKLEYGSGKMKFERE